jgi:hypothetical protein
MNIKDVKNAMNVLKDRYNKKAEQVEIVIAWWDKEWFELMLDTNLSDEEWWDIAIVAEGVLENSDIGQYMMTEALETLKQLRKKGDK